MLKAVLFDLDGTLLQLDTKNFMEVYLREIAGIVAHVVEPRRFTTALLASTTMMMEDRNPEVSNFEIFWQDFRDRLSDCINELEPLFEEFYASKFRNLSLVTSPSEFARRAVEAALNRGWKVALATNSIFPRSAIIDRLVWAGLEDLPWDFIACYEDMHFCKPHHEYYLEILERMQLEPGECLMVGNDVEQDMVAGELGLGTCLVNDFLIKRGNSGFQPHWSGSLKDLVGWLAGVDFQAYLIEKGFK